MLHWKNCVSKLLVLSLFAVAASGCGAAGGGDDVDEVVVPPPPANLEMTIVADDANDGYLRQTGIFSFDVHAAADIYIGDAFGAWGRMRGFLRFDLASLVGKNILSAQLVMTQASHVGLPWTVPGGMDLQRIDMGAGLNSFDWLTPTLETVLTHTTPLGDGDSVTWDVTAAVLADLADDQLSDFRLRLPNATPSGTYVRFHDAGSGAEVAPKLIVTYQD